MERRCHPLGHRRPCSPHLRYFLRDRQARTLGCRLFDCAAPRLVCRDRWLGCRDQKHHQYLHLVVRPARCLPLPWVTVPNPARHALSRVARRWRGMGDRRTARNRSCWRPVCTPSVARIAVTKQPAARTRTHRRDARPRHAARSHSQPSRGASAGGVDLSRRRSGAGATRGRQRELARKGGWTTGALAGWAREPRDSLRGRPRTGCDS